METISFQNTLLYQFKSLRAFSQVKHVISTKSSGNISFKTGESKDVIAVRQRVSDFLEVPLASLVVPQQTHSNKVAIVGREDQGKGAFEHDSAIAGVDALITKEKKTPLMALSADCPVIAFFDPLQEIIAVAHAGWRGAVAQMALATVEKMKKELGANPKDICAWIAPAIGPCCYEVSADLAREVVEKLPQGETFIHEKEGQVFFDLWKANRFQLLSAGVEQVEVAQTCTLCHPQEHFYSYRSDKEKAGRFGFFLSLV